MKNACLELVLLNTLQLLLLQHFLLYILRKSKKQLLELTY